MKFKTTQKAIKNNHVAVVKVGYNRLYFLLRYQEPAAYTTRSKGWASDVYCFGNVAISTGYSPFGNVELSAEEIHNWNERAAALLDEPMGSDEMEKKTNAILNEFLSTISKMIEKGGSK